MGCAVSESTRNIYFFGIYSKFTCFFVTSSTTNKRYYSILSSKSFAFSCCTRLFIPAILSFFMLTKSKYKCYVSIVLVG